MSRSQIVFVFLFATLFTDVTNGAPRTRRSADVTIFAHENYRGRTLSYSLGRSCRNLLGSFRDEVTSVRVNSGCVQLCRFDNCMHCTDVRESYSDLADISLNDQIRSLRRCDDDPLDYQYV
ncbi:unnamed protein product [Allacma fusca]|uniref:Beta/gamma crystallin 'Greek key' domain-containing protein n=1 Tax=Allacma fusca TaxID=39272 RepID=A0A8J2J603_9HEXA|nr:unnamed protein product [Allacma fusca]